MVFSRPHPDDTVITEMTDETISDNADNDSSVVVIAHEQLAAFSNHTRIKE